MIRLSPLKSGETIKTINGQSIVGAGNLVIEGSGGATSAIRCSSIILTDIDNNDKQYKLYILKGEIIIEEVSE